MRTWFLTPVILAAVSGAAFGAPSRMSIGDVRAIERDSGMRSVEVTVAMPPPASGPVTVMYSTRDGTALAASDYRAASGTVAFAPGEVTKKIVVQIIGDTQ